MIFRYFLLALGFLTHIPCSTHIKNYSNNDLGYSVLFYPLVGAVIGLILVFIFYCLPSKDFILDAALLLVIWNLLTGGLHIDGLSDSADAWIGGHHEKERVFAIMQDSSCGPIGVMIVFSVLVLKLTALTTLIIHNQIITPLIFTPIISRTAIIGLFLSTKYIQTNEIGAIMHDNMPRKLAVIVIMTFSLILILMPGKIGLKILLITIVGGYMVRKFIRHKLGGVTGDTAGAFIEIIEMLVLVGLAL